MDQWEGLTLIHIYVTVILVILCGGLMYYGISQAFNGVSSVMETAWPSYFTGSWWTFTSGFMTWLPFFAIILSCLIFVIVWSQKKGSGVYG